MLDRFIHNWRENNYQMGTGNHYRTNVLLTMLVLAPVISWPVYGLIKLF